MLVLLSFIVLALLWFLREPRFIPGWGDLFPQEENGNRCAACQTLHAASLLMEVKMNMHGLMYIMNHRMCEVYLR